MKASHIIPLAGLIILACCVHHSHQEENLSVGKTSAEHRKVDHADHEEANEDHDHHHHHSHECLESDEECHSHGKGSPRVWLEASAAVILISLCGIFGVLVIPIMQKIFYQHLIQFLVALAVGSLSGDALLHLLPHSFLKGIDIDGETLESIEKSAIWKGFYALIAFVVFFLLERVINMMGELREARSRRKEEERKEADGNENGRKKERKFRVIRSGHKASENAERVCKHKYSSYCVSDIEAKNALESKQTSITATSEQLPIQPQIAIVTPAASVPPNATEESLCISEETELIIKNNQQQTEPPNSNNGPETPSNNHNNLHTDLLQPLSTLPSTTSMDTVFVREHEHRHHGHSHAHSHITSRPKSISSVAWMVIFGDGIHNFVDGLSIGAAMTRGLPEGISIALALSLGNYPHGEALILITYVVVLFSILVQGLSLGKLVQRLTS